MSPPGWRDSPGAHTRTGVLSALVVPAASGSAGRAASSPVVKLRSTASLSRPTQADPGREGRAAMRSQLPRTQAPRTRAPRTLPARPSLRHLKLEAKRRRAAGEFVTLHDAQPADDR